MLRFPQDCPARRIGSRARAIFHYQLDSDVWDYRELTGQDVGVDCEIETASDGQWENKILKCQIKGTTRLKYIDGRKRISFPLDIKTISYALSCPNPFVFVIVDVAKEETFWTGLQEMFINDPSLFKKVELNKNTVSLHIPVQSNLKATKGLLVDLASKSYIGEPGKDLRVAK